jgi:hypothetical protein
MKRRSLYALALPLSVFLASCTGPLQGPVVDIQTVVAPDPVSAPLPAPVPAPLAAGTWRAYIPRQTDSAGDTVEGHYLELSTAPPVMDVREPRTPIPRAPKHPLVKPVVQPAQTPALVATPPALPEGMAPSRTQRVPPQRPTIPGGLP